MAQKWSNNLCIAFKQFLKKLTSSLSEARWWAFAEWVWVSNSQSIPLPILTRRTYAWDFLRDRKKTRKDKAPERTEELATVRVFLCREAHTKDMHVRFLTKPEEDEESQGPKENRKELATVRVSLCLFWREAHTKDMHVRFPTRPEEDEESQGPRENRKELATARERRRLERGRCWRRGLEPVNTEAGSAIVGGWVNVPGSCVGVLFEYTFVKAKKQKMTEKFPNFSFLTLRAYPSPCLFVLYFTHGYICYICYIFVKHVKCLWPEMRETTRRSFGHKLIYEVEIEGIGRAGHIVTQKLFIYNSYMYIYTCVVHLSMFD